MPDDLSVDPPSGERARPAVRSEPQPQPVMLHLPVNIRSASLGILAFLASLFAMQWAREVLIPILLGIMMSYALTPLVAQLHRWRVPRAIGATLLLSAILGAIGWGVVALSGQANALLETLPQITQKIRQLTEGSSGRGSAIGKVEQAAAEIEAVANPGAGPAPAATVVASGAAAAGAASSATPDAGAAQGRKSSAADVSAARATAPAARPRLVAGLDSGHPRIDVRGYLLSGTLGALALLGQVAVVFFIALFLLSSGNSFRRKMVKLAGPRFSQKKVTIETLDEITGQIQRYLLVQVGISVLVGIATWLTFFAIGLEQSAVWGVVAGVTNLIPYVGAVFVGAGSTIVGFVQFGTVEMALLVGCSSFAIHTVIGNILTPWWMGRASRMSPFAVFVAVLLFGWLWGVWGLLLGVPILLVVKTVCDRVDDLKPLGELLGA